MSLDFQILAINFFFWRNSASQSLADQNRTERIAHQFPKLSRSRKLRAASACRAATRKPRHPALCSYYFIISYLEGQPAETLQHPHYHLKAPTTRRRNDNLGTWITVYPGPEISDGANVHGRRLPASLTVQNNLKSKQK